MPLQNNLDNANNFLDWMHPNEQHNAGGMCPNPKCGYVLTPQDEQEIHQDHGWWVCPNCHMSFNMLDETYNGQPGGSTRAFSITPMQMGQIGEQVVLQMGQVPTLGKVVQYYGEDAYHNPIDFQIGAYGVEVKTIHSEVASPRFKLTGGGGRSRQDAIYSMLDFCQNHELKPAMVGVRLNFYTDLADIFAREGLADTWISSANMPHVATYNFKALNPYKNPEEVPPPSEMPQDDETDPDEGIPF